MKSSFLRKMIYGIKNGVLLVWKHKWWILLFAFMVLLIGFSLIRIIIDWPSDCSGWGQLIIEAFTLPTIAFELSRISKELAGTLQSFCSRATTSHYI
jgi:hypothetical protein